MADQVPEEPQVAEAPRQRGVLAKNVLPALAGTAALYGAVQGLGSMATDQGRDRNVFSRLWQFHKMRRLMGIPYGAVDLYDASSPAYSPYHNIVMGPVNMGDGSLAHELGHAINHETLSPDSHAFMNMQLPGRVLPLTLPAALYSAGAERPSLIPGAIVAALNAPVLADEAAASARAVYHLARRDGLRGLVESASLLPAFGTYAVSALGPLGLAMLRRGLHDRAVEALPAPSEPPPSEERTSQE